MSLNLNSNEFCKRTSSATRNHNHADAAGVGNAGDDDDNDKPLSTFDVYKFDLLCTRCV